MTHKPTGSITNMSREEECCFNWEQYVQPRTSVA